MTRPLLLDLFCGAGGAAMGYHRAGFDVIGCDHKPQPRYPFDFMLGDALNILRYFGPLADAIHASPPCQRYSKVNRMAHLSGKDYPDLLAPTRELLVQTGKPWVIENVLGAPLSHAVMCCGSAFGLLVRRHRYFESSVVLFGTACRHAEQDTLGPRFPTAFRDKDWRSRGQPRLSTVVQVYGHTAGKHIWPEAMGINWMTSHELTQAIPPAYTEYLGRQLLRALEHGGTP